MRKRSTRAVAIEYVMITMALVAALVSALLIAASISAQTARKERDYIEKKSFLDGSASAFIQNAQTGDFSFVELEQILNENDYGIVFRVSTNELVGTLNRSVVIYVSLSGEERSVTAYRYRYI